jgi:hypothetical protein
MTAPRTIATVSALQGYEGLHQAMRARAEELSISREQIDELASLTRGHAGKLLAPYPIKAIGRTTLGPMLYALKLKLIVVPDDEIVWAEAPLERVNCYAKNAVATKPLHKGMANNPEIRSIRRKVLSETMQKNGRKGGLKSGRVRRRKSLIELRRSARKAWRTRKRNALARRRATRNAPGLTPCA